MAPSSEAISFEDMALVQQTQAGDIRAFEGLVVKYQDRVYRICLKLVGDQESAQDMAQEAFIKAYEGIGDFEHKSSFYTWLFRITVNLCISYRRKMHRINQQTVRVVNYGESVGGEQEGYQALKLHALVEQKKSFGPAEDLKQREMQQAVRAALEQLEQDQRAILVLRDIESLDYEAIAEVLDIPLGTVRSRLHRARLAMRELLKPVMEKAG